MIESRCLCFCFLSPLCWEANSRPSPQPLLLDFLDRTKIFAIFWPVTTLHIFIPFTLLNTHISPTTLTFPSATLKSAFRPHVCLFVSPTTVRRGAPRAAIDVIMTYAPSITQLLNLQGMNPLGVERFFFHRGHLRPWKNTDIYIIIHDSSKITV